MRPEDLFPPGEFVKKWKDFYHKALRESPYTVKYNAFSGSKILQLTFNILKRGSDIFGISVFARDITERMQMEEAIEEKSNDLLKAYDATLQGWSNALELREHETAGHCLRVVQLTVDLAKLQGIDSSEIIEIQRGALLHDIGKMGIPDSILLKPGPLTEDEWVTMRQHPIYAYNLLSNIPYLKKALEIPYCHHEKWDGSGYPRKLKGLEIPVSARIFAVVDVWDALSSNRPYRPAWP
jgi:HD-GYP domain-containing protein (c-di-GMP phosphodiesterase class II)